MVSQSRKMDCLKDVTAQLLSPQDGKISVDISGEASIVDKITAAQITAVINLQNVSSGTKDISIQVSGPGNISIEPKQKSAKVTIVKKEKPDKEVQGNGQQPDSNTDQENQNEKPKILNLIQKRTGKESKPKSKSR